MQHILNGSALHLDLIAQSHDTAKKHATYLPTLSACSSEALFTVDVASKDAGILAKCSHDCILQIMACTVAACCCSGVVHDFDRLRHRHTVSYQDGDIEIVPLWAPNQMVSVHATVLTSCISLRSDQTHVYMTSRAWEVLIADWQSIALNGWTL